MSLFAKVTPSPLSDDLEEGDAFQVSSPQIHQFYHHLGCTFTLIK